jgi:hypothetical protein
VTTLRRRSPARPGRRSPPATSTRSASSWGSAGKQQGGLTDFLPADKAHGVWALNDVGTCCFIEGQAFEKQGRKTEAAAAYKTLTTSYRFAQCWDPKGWFWRPAEAAAGRLDQLDFDAVLDAK